MADSQLADLDFNQNRLLNARLHPAAGVADPTFPVTVPGLSGQAYYDTVVDRGMLWSAVDAAFFRIPRIDKAETVVGTWDFSPPAGSPFTVGNSIKVVGLNSGLLADQADTGRAGDTGAVINTVAIRDGSAHLAAVVFNASTGFRVAGTATSGNVLRGNGTNFVDAQLQAGDIGGGQPLTRVDDTNVTLTLGGSPTTALLAATSITVGWSGLLSLARGGSNANLTAVQGGLVYSTATAFAITAALTGVLIGNGTGVPSAVAGTNNYHPKWSANTLTATSLIYDDGTKLGFNNPSPTYDFDFLSTENGGAQLALTNLSAGNAASTGFRLVNDASVAVFRYYGSGHATLARDVVFENNDAAGSIRFYYDGAYNFMLFNDGSVLINTTSAAAGSKLNVNGVINSATGYRIGNTATLANVLRGDGTDFVSAQLQAADIGGGAALTKADDTNVTLTLGGSPATALLAATSITVGWTGQLAIARGGHGQATAVLGFNALSPLTTRGDLLTRDATNNVRLGIGASTYVLTSNGTDASWQAVPGGFTGFANPTASVGLTAVNGVAVTAMRSDAAPPIDQAIAPVWTLAHTWRRAGTAIQADEVGDSVVRYFLTTSGGMGWGPGNAAVDTTLGRTASGVLALSNILDVATGYRLAGAAASANYLRGNGTNFVSSAIQAGDIPDISGTYVPVGRTITIAGTANRVTSSAGAQDLSANRTWTLDIAATYVGQTSITTLGTVTTGAWNGSVIPVAYGGTNVNAFTLNGVLYASSTSQVATSAALTWDGSTLGITGGTNAAMITAATGTSKLQFVMSNTGGNLYMGLESSAGGGVFTGTTAYATVFGNATTTPVQFAQNGLLRWSIIAGEWVGNGARTIQTSTGILTLLSDTRVDIDAVCNATTGFRVANAATSGNVLLGNGTNFVSAQLQASNIGGGAALTRVDDTNITATLGGSPATALLAATSITLGWTGTLAAARLNANVVQSVVNDTNVTGSIAAQTLTLGWTGLLSLARGGTNANLTAVQGGLVYSTATAFAITAVLSGIVQGNGTSAPTGVSGTQYGLPYWATTTTVGTTAAGTATTLLHGNASGIPTWSAVSMTADVTGVLPVANGGTNVNAFTANGVLYASSTSQVATSSNLTWNGSTLSLLSTASLSWNGDLFLFRDGANKLGLRSGTSPQELRIYSTYTSSTNYENLDVFFSGGMAWIITDKGSGGGTQRPLNFGTDTTGAKYWQLAATTPHFLASVDNTFDIGASGATRPRTVYLGTSLVSPVVNATTGFQVAGAATSGNVLRGNGTNFVSAQLAFSDTSGTVTVARGGTNVTSLTANGVLYASSTSQVATGTALAWDGSDLYVVGGIRASPAVGTGRVQFSITSTGGSLYYGTESSAGGGIFTGSTAYAAVFGTGNTTPVQFFQNGSLRWSIIAGELVGNGARTIQTSTGILTLLSDTRVDIDAVCNATTGFRVANAATSGNVLRGNGTNFVSAQLAFSDLSGSFGVSQGGTGAATFTAGLIRSPGGTTALTSVTGTNNVVPRWSSDSLASTTITTGGTHVAINGCVAIGTATEPSTAAIGLTVTHSLSGSGLNQIGLRIIPTVEAATVTNFYGAYTVLTTPNNASAVIGNVYSSYIGAITKGAASTVTNAYGLYIAAVTGIGATLNYSLYVAGGYSYFGAPIYLGDTIGTVDTGIFRLSAGVVAVTSIVDVNTGFRVAGAATSGNVLRGNATNFVSAQLSLADCSAGALAAGTTSSTPSGGTDVANKNYVDGLITSSGLISASVTTTGITPATLWTYAIASGETINITYFGSAREQGTDNAYIQTVSVCYKRPVGGGAPVLLGTFTVLNVFPDVIGWSLATAISGNTIILQALSSTLITSVNWNAKITVTSSFA